MARILIVDDDATIRELVALHLVGHGHEVKAAANAECALNLAIQETFDLLITDIEMPEIDGIELALAVRAEEKTGNLPIIFLSSLNDDATRKQTKHLGGVLVSKCLASRKLANAVSRVLRACRGLRTSSRSSADLRNETCGL
jgi:two-component system, chemotaxis family, chemotaxis protein CheY